MKRDAKLILRISYHCVSHRMLVQCWVLVFNFCNMYSDLHEEKGINLSSFIFVTNCAFVSQVRTDGVKSANDIWEA